MAAPTTPTIPQIAALCEVTALAQLLIQFRRVESVAGGTPSTLTDSNAGRLLSLVVQSARSTVTAKGGTPGTRKWDTDSQVSILVELLRQCRFLETRLAGTPKTTTDSNSTKLRYLVVESLQRALVAAGGTASTKNYTFRSGTYADMVLALRGLENLGI